MSSIVQILRRLTGNAGSPPETGRKEGELFANLQDGTHPELWVFGGNTTTGTAPANKGWLRLNPDPSISVVSKTISGTNDPATDGNSQAAATGQWPWVVSTGQVPIVTHDGTAYAFTGGVGKWGTTSGGTALTAGMFTPLGAAPGQPAIYDWSSRTEANIGAAYTAWNGAAPTTNAFGNGLVLVKWKDGATYVLINPSAPANPASYSPAAATSPTVNAGSLDWSALAGGPYTTPQAAYAAWHALDTTKNVLDPNQITVVKWGTPVHNSLIVDPANPTAASSYADLHPAADVLAFTTTYDVTVAYNPATMAPAHPGDFGLVAKSGTIIDNSPNAQWPIAGTTPGTTQLKQGDMLVWDGALFHPLAAETDLSAYVLKAGDTMTSAAVLTFAVPTAAATAPTVRLDGSDAGKSSIDNFTIDCGVI